MLLMSFDEQDRQSNRVAPPPSGVIPALPAGGGWATFLSAEGTPYQAHEVRQSRGARYRTCLSKLIRVRQAHLLSATGNGMHGTPYGFDAGL